MKTVKVHKVTDQPAKNGNLQVTVLVGAGSARRSVTRHIHPESGVWVGNNPDPETIRQRESAARTLRQAQTQAHKTETELDVLRKSLQRELKPEEMMEFLDHGLQTETKVKAMITDKIIPVFERRLVEERKIVDNAAKYKAEIEEAFPVTVQFVGF